MADDPAVFLSVPVAVWSGLAAAAMALIGTLGGVVATNWGNTKRLRLQLEHDAGENAKERLTTLRRGLYLDAVEANIRALAYFGTMPQADFTKPDADQPIRNMLAIGAQLQLVVSQETARLVSEVIAASGELHLRLIPRVLPMHQLRSNIKIRDVLYENAQAEVNRILAAMTQLNESGHRDAAQFNRLNSSFEVASRASELATNERSAFWGQANALQREYIRDFTSVRHV